MDARRNVVILLALSALAAGCERPPAPAVADADAITRAPARVAAPAPPAPPLLAIASAEGAGQYLVDGEGRSLYVLNQDKGAGTCLDVCAQRWPPLPAGDGVAAPIAAPVQAGSVGRTTRADGTVQVTYSARPLYRYTGDAAPGHRTGHDLTDEFGHWSLVDPDGQPLERD